MKTNIFDYHDYKVYLRAAFETNAESRGRRAQLARALKCQTAFVSQVLRGSSHFTLDHAIQVNGFLGHSEPESHYFMLLVQKARADGMPLKAYFERQIAEIKKSREDIRERVHSEKLPPSRVQEVYFGTWYYCAIHVMLSAPRFHSADVLALHLGLPRELVSRCLEFLETEGFVIREKHGFRVTARRIHLGKDSPYLTRHHTNWRMRALHSLDVGQPEDMHFSSVISLSNEDAVRVKALLLKSIEQTEPILKASKEENAFAMGIDFFRI